MALDSYVPSATKAHILRKAFPAGDTYKIALYTSDPQSDKYTSRGEVSGQGYQAGGKILDGYACDLSGSTAFVNWRGPQWPHSTITATHALVYNSTDGNTVVAALEFDETVSKNGLFTVELPSNGPAALISL